MTTQLTTLARIITELKELNEFDGETVEYLLKEIGYEDYILRHLIMSESITDIENAYEERIEYEFTINDVTIKHPLVHRLKMVKDDVEAIKTFIEVQNLDDEFGRPTHCADSCFTHFSNIFIACDLTSKESLSWTRFNSEKEEENPEEPSIKTEWRDIQNFTIEARKLCLKVWEENEVLSRKRFLTIYDVKTIDLILIVHEFWNDIENCDTNGYNSFSEYWQVFIVNRKNIVSLQNN